MIFDIFNCATMTTHNHRISFDFDHDSLIDFLCMSASLAICAVEHSDLASGGDCGGRGQALGGEYGDGTAGPR